MADYSYLANFPGAIDPSKLTGGEQLDPNTLPISPDVLAIMVQSGILPPEALGPNYAGQNGTINGINVTGGQAGVQFSGSEGGIDQAQYTPGGFVAYDPANQKTGDIQALYSPGGQFQQYAAITGGSNAVTDMTQAISSMVVMIVAPYLAPYVIAAADAAGIALSEAAAAAVSNAVVNVTVTAASGGNVSAAFENGLISVGMAGVSPDFLSSITTDPKISGMVTSAASSAIQTAASGGGMDAIAKAAAAGAAGAGVGGVVGDQSFGKIVGTALSGQDPAGAIAGAAGGAIQQQLNGSGAAPAPAPATTSGSTDLAPSSDAQQLIDQFKQIQGGQQVAFGGDPAEYLQQAQAATQALLQKYASTPAGQAILQEAETFLPQLKTYAGAGLAGGAAAILGAGVALSPDGTYSNSYWGQQQQQKTDGGNSGSANQIPTTGGTYGNDQTVTTTPAPPPAGITSGSTTVAAPPPTSVGTAYSLNPEVDAAYTSDGTPVTADVMRAAQMSGISIDEAYLLKLQSPTTFAQQFGGDPGTSFIAADPATQPAGSMTWQERMGRPDLLNTDVTQGVGAPVGLNFQQDNVLTDSTQIPSATMSPAPAPLGSIDPSTSPSVQPSTQVQPGTSPAPAPAPNAQPQPQPQPQAQPPALPPAPGTTTTTAAPPPVLGAPSPAPSPTGYQAPPPNVVYDPTFDPFNPNAIYEPGATTGGDITAPGSTSIGTPASQSPASWISATGPSGYGGGASPRDPLNAAFYSPLEQGLSGYVPAGSVDAETGKPRQDVWNEASLRLKDALGI